MNAPPAGWPRDSIDMLRRLVAFDTTSRDSNLALIDWVRSYLAELGVSARLVHDETGTKANLFATLGPADRPGIVLSGHTDVVPVDDQDWTGDPFTLAERDGRLFGRGTCDMKGFLAVCLAHVPAFLAADLAWPVHLAFSYDEEVGCLGVRRLLADLADQGLRPRGCVVGEPTGMRVITAHKGKVSFEVHVRGREGHSSRPRQAVNAVEYAARLIAFITDMATRLTDRDPAFEPPVTTSHVGMIRGGVALNIVPRDCHFAFEFRTLPEVDGQALVDAVAAHAHSVLLPEMRQVWPGADITFTPLGGIPGLDTDPAADIVRLAQAASGANTTGKVAYGTEAGLFDRAGIPTVICGPGEIDQAHAADEFVSVDQIRACDAFMTRLIDRLRR